MSRWSVIAIAPSGGSGLDAPMAFTSAQLARLAAHTPDVGIHVVTPASRRADYASLLPAGAHVLPIPTAGVAAAVNEVMADLSGLVTFVLPGTDPIAQLASWRRTALGDGGAWTGMRAASAWGTGQSSRFLDPAHPGGVGAPLGWLMAADTVSIDNTVLDASTVLALGGFDEDTSLGDGWWWQFTTQAAAAGQLQWRAVPAAGRSYPLRMLTGAPSMSGAALRRRVSVELTRTLQRTRGRDGTPECRGLIQPERKTRIVVLAGVNEPAHSQLAFLNYFQHPLLSSEVEWSVVFDDVATSNDIVDADILILNRVRSANGVRLLTEARTRGIASLYFIDDNWFSAAHDIPALAELFGENSPTMRLFRRAIREADAVLTLNENLAEDCAAAGARVRLHRPAIDITAHPETTRDPRKPVTLGFLGSTRVSRSAFVAARRILDEVPGTDVAVFGNDPAHEFDGVAPARLRRHHWVFDYDDYTRVARGLAVDILIAPLGSSRLEQSKCPNKYLESAVIGAAGVYSDSPVYADVVTDGENGILVRQDDADAWAAGIRRLLDADERARIISRARSHVMAEHSIEGTMPEFTGLLRDLIEARR